MLDLLQDNWYTFALLFLYVSTKLNRHFETKTKKKDEGALKDADNLVLSVVKMVRDGVVNKEEREKVLVDVSHEIGNKNRYLRTLVDGVLPVLEKMDTRELKIVKGSHPLEVLANRAVKAESKKQKIKNGAKRAAVLTLKAIRSGLL